MSKHSNPSTTTLGYNFTCIHHLLIQGTPTRHGLNSQYLHTYCPDDINASVEGHAQATHLATPSLTAVQVTQMVHLHDQIHKVEVLEKNLQIQTADETEILPLAASATSKCLTIVKSCTEAICTVEP